MRTICRVLLLACLVSAVAQGLAAAESVAVSRKQTYVAVAKRYLFAQPDASAPPTLLPNDELELLGGVIEHRAADRVTVALPDAAVDIVRQHRSVKYLQPALSGPFPEKNASTAVVGPKRLSAVTDALTPATDAAWGPRTYTYDGVGNITQIGTDTYAYDALGRLRTAVISGRTETFDYDSFGNLKERITEGVPLPIPVSSGTNRLSGYAYSGDGSILDAARYKYDAAGMLREKDGERYVYTANEERIGVLSGDRWLWSFRDEAGRVLRQYESVASAPAAAWLWIEDYVYRDDARLAAERYVEEGGRRHFHLDHLGTPRVITGEDGLQVSAHDYWPFGNHHPNTPLCQEDCRGFSREDPMKFTGHERDLTSTYPENTNYLDYMHARYYQPGWGRFLSVDPNAFWELQQGSDEDRAKFRGYLRRPQTWNRYAYVLNNPLRYTDPDGRDHYPEPGFTKPMTAENLAMDENTPGVIKAAFYAEGGLLALGAVSELGPPALSYLGDAALSVVTRIRSFAAIAEATRRVISDPNRMSHIFNNAGHKDGLVRSVGSQQEVVNAVARGVVALGKISTNANGVFSVTVRINGQNVEVTGRIIRDVINISNFWVR